VRQAAAALGNAVADAARAWPAVAAAVVLVSAAAIAGRRRHVRRRRGPPPVGAARAFADLEAAMSARGHPRRDTQTPSEFVRTITPHLAADERDDARLIARVFERDRFSGRRAPDEEETAALAASRRLATPASRKRSEAASATRSTPIRS
jgi:hypothetical protein